MNKEQQENMLAAVLASLESVLEGCSDFPLDAVVLPSRNVTHNDLIEAYEHILQEAVTLDFSKVK